MFKKSGTRKIDGGMQGDIMIRGGGGMQGNMMIENSYTEKPRPNLYNVIKRLREMKGPMIHRMCYISKNDES